MTTKEDKQIEAINDLIKPFENYEEKEKLQVTRAVYDDILKLNFPNHILNKAGFDFKKITNIKSEKIEKLLTPMQQEDYNIRKTYLERKYGNNQEETSENPEKDETYYVYDNIQLENPKYFNTIIHRSQVILIDKYRHSIFTAKEKEKDGTTYLTNETLVINAEPVKISEIQNKITRIQHQNNQISTYEIQWKYHNGRERKTTGTLKQITKTMYENGSIDPNTSQYKLQNIIGLIIDDAIIHKQVDIITQPPEPGFYIDPDTHKFINNSYKNEEPTKHNIHVALNTLNQLIEYFDSTIIAEIVRWGLKAPYQYMIKQNGGEGQFLYIEGEPNTGKSKILGALPLYIWDLNPQKNTYGGATRSMAQLSEVMSRTTFPQIIDDFASINSVVTNSLLKSAAIGLQSRSKYDNDNNFKEYPALSPLIFTSNNQLDRDIEDTAHLRRFRQIHLYEKDIPSADKQKEFNKVFKIMEGDKNQLKQLKYLGQTFYTWMLENKDKIMYDPDDEAIIKFIHELREKTHYNLPIRWLEEHIEKETLEEMKNSIKSEVINRIAELITGKDIAIIKYDDNGKFDENAVITTLQDQIDARINQRKIPWLYKSKDDTSYVITARIKKDMKDLNITLPKLAELFNWKYGHQRINKSNQKAIRVNKQEFIFLIYNPYWEE